MMLGLDLTYFIVLFFVCVSIILSMARVKTGEVLFPIVSHSIFNVFNFNFNFNFKVLDLSYGHYQ